MEKLTFLAEELFHEIPDDPDNVMMTIPPEICEAQGWKEGDTLEWKDRGDGSWSLEKKSV